ncbi:hypothetical protein ACIPXV_10660 [Streptomyces libani]|uniref:hypothetical protein n=1 Tax=Streptomyces nigrescens TaxID=1920 RepID=UPI003804DE26
MGRHHPTHHRHPHRPHRLRAQSVLQPDGSTLATNNDGSIRLWNTRTTRLRATLTGPTTEGYPRYVSPNGHALATLTPPQRPRVWSTDADYVTTPICRLSTDHHWAQLLPTSR